MQMGDGTVAFRSKCRPPHRYTPLEMFTLAAAVAVLPHSGAMPVSSRPFGSADGQSVELFTLTNRAGMKAEIMNYGATVVSLTAPDRNGKFEDVVCGFDNLLDYQSKSPYFGCIVGRYGNRIAGGKFSLRGHTYRLAVNNGPNSLHGGVKGFDKRVWKVGPQDRSLIPRLRLSYTSKHMEEGYPGKLTVNVVYTLTDDNALRIDYSITTDRDTVQNITNHTYFNLAGSDARDNLDHEMQIDADRFTPVDSTLIPLGELRSVDGTPFDFRRPIAIGARIDGDDEQLRFGGGYDHNWVLNGKWGTLRHAGRVYEPTSGRVMDFETTEPGVQFYSGNFLDGTLIGKGGKVYPHRFAFCLETQHFPDSPNHAAFPSTVLKKGATYRSTTIYRFGSR